MIGQRHTHCARQSHLHSAHRRAHADTYTLTRIQSLPHSHTYTAIFSLCFASWTFWFAHPLVFAWFDAHWGRLRSTRSCSTELDVTTVSTRAGIPLRQQIKHLADVIAPNTKRSSIPLYVCMHYIYNSDDREWISEHIEVKSENSCSSYYNHEGGNKINE